MAIIRTAQAEEDLIHLWVYIAQDNPSAADRTLDRIDERCEAIASHPRMGRALTEIRAGVHYVPVGHYLVFYQVLAADVSILRVLHSARDWQEILMETFNG